MHNVTPGSKSSPPPRTMRRFGAAVLACAAIWIVTASGQQPDAQALPYVTGELLVRFRPAALTARRNAALSAQSARLIRRFEEIDLHHLRLRAGQTVAAALAAFQSNPDVLAAQPNYIRYLVASAPPNDPSWLDDSLWGLRKIMAQSAWTNFTTGDGTVVVADIDTGVNYNHPDLAANIWSNPGEIPGNGIDDDHNGYVDDVHGIDTVNHDSDPMDDNGHGTHTAGTIGAVGNNAVGVVGVSWNVRILACKFLSVRGSGTDAGAIECFNYLTALKNRGINLRVSSNSWGSARDGAVPMVFKNAIDAAGNAGILNIFAAGNTGTNNDVAPFDPATFTSTSIVSVAASDSSDNRAGFSNYGATSVDLAAPGVSIRSTYGGGYADLSGTSMATPHVAGAAALLFAQKPALTISAAKSRLLDGVDRPGQWTGLVASGGRLNVYGAALANAGDIPPMVGITAPLNSATLTVPPAITVTATASDSDGSVSLVAFYANGELIGTAASGPYSVSWNPAAGTYTLTAVATDNAGVTTTSAAVGVEVTTMPAVAAFRGSDTTTQGNWIGAYGGQGYGLIDDSVSYPAFAQVTVSGAGAYAWTLSTTDPRGLQRPAATDRVAACWYSGGSFTIDVNLTDGVAHQVALYALDWDGSGARTQQVDLVDAISGAVLDTHTLAGFHGGQYLVWTVSGHVTLRVTNTGQGNAVVSGLFFDP